MNSEIQLASEGRAALEDCFAKIRLARATELAQSKRFLEAEALLSPNGELPENLRELDLLARIAAQQRQFARARRLWQAVLEKEPTHEPAKAALAKLGSPWIALVYAKRFAFLAGIATLLSLSAVGLFAVFYGFPSSEPSPRATTVPRATKSAEQIHTSAANPAINREDSVATGPSPDSFERLRQMQEEQARSLNAKIQLVQSNQMTLLQNQSHTAERIAILAQPLEALAQQQRDTKRLLEQTRDDIKGLAQAQARAVQPATNSLVVPQRRASLNFQIKGISLIPQQAVWILRFDTGLFERDDYFKIGSKALLQSAAKALVRTQEKMRVEVVGFAEEEAPTWPWSKPLSESELGLARAKKVQHFLESLGIFPPNALSTISGSPTERPFQSENRNNRTVVLRIYQE